jgi:3-dehydroquinate synthase
MSSSLSPSDSAPTRIDVAAASGSYPVYVGAGAWSSLPALLDEAGTGARRVFVSSPVVWHLHGAALEHAGGVDPILVSDGERSKTTATVGRVYDALIERRADRGTVIVAVGGGVIGDLVGFAAATFLRGLPFVQLPTTLMAQVDSAIGGKVGVNHPQGKNLVGAFHAPRAVIADPIVLNTLHRREFRAGLYEVVKYGAIANPTLIERLSHALPRIFAREAEIVTGIVAESCRIKARIVSADEHEAGLRRVLNFGHTIGHALEAATRYRRYRHGEAVAYGMLAALALGVARGVTSAEARDRVAALIRLLGPLPPIGDLAASEILGAIQRDKKIVEGRLHFVAVRELGTTTTLTDVTERELRASLAAIGVKG